MQGETARRAETRRGRDGFRLREPGGLLNARGQHGDASGQLATRSLSRGGTRATFIAGVRREDVQRWLEEHGPWLEGKRAARGGAIGRDGSPGAPAVIAKARARSRARALLDRVVGRAGRLARGFRIGLILAAAGVRAARPLALLEAHGLSIRAVLILERLEGVNLREFLLERDAGEGGARRGPERPQLWAAVAATIAALHRAGVRQRDLKAPNIIVRDGGRGVEAHLVDLDGMDEAGKPPPWRARRRDLARLAASFREPALRARGIGEADWATVVAAYLQAFEGRAPGATEVRSLVATTLAWAERKAARNRRRGRVVE